jgi:hypothetical protein
VLWELVFGSARPVASGLSGWPKQRKRSKYRHPGRACRAFFVLFVVCRGRVRFIFCHPHGRPVLPHGHAPCISPMRPHSHAPCGPMRLHAAPPTTPATGGPRLDPSGERSQIPAGAQEQEVRRPRLSLDQGELLLYTALLRLCTHRTAAYGLAPHRPSQCAVASCLQACLC